MKHVRGRGTKPFGPANPLLGPRSRSGGRPGVSPTLQGVRGQRPRVLSVVVPATDRPATLARITAAIRRAQAPPDEVIVVDGPPELSAAAARNLGARRAAGDLLVFVDADVEVHRDAFARIRAAFDADPDLTAVFGSYDDRPSARGRISVFRNLLHHHVHQASAGPAETFWAGLGAVRRDAFLAVGGFDEGRYPHPSVEDIELGVRLAGRGARLRLDPRIQGTHLKTWTLRTMVWTDFARRGIPWVALQLHSGRPSTALTCGWHHRLSAAACLLAGASAVRRSPTGVALSGLTLVSLNRSFYRLLARHGGRRDALLGVALHALHHLTAVASLVGGLAAHLHERTDGDAVPGARAPLVPRPTLTSPAMVDDELSWIVPAPVEIAS